MEALNKESGASKDMLYAKIFSDFKPDFTPQTGQPASVDAFKHQITPASLFCYALGEEDETVKIDYKRVTGIVTPTKAKSGQSFF